LGTQVSCAKTNSTDQDAIWGLTVTGPRNHVLEGGPDLTLERLLLRVTRRDAAFDEITLNTCINNYINTTYDVNCTKVKNSLQQN